MADGWITLPRETNCANWTFVETMMTYLQIGGIAGYAPPIIHPLFQKAK